MVTHSRWPQFRPIWLLAPVLLLILGGPAVLAQPSHHTPTASPAAQSGKHAGPVVPSATPIALTFSDVQPADYFYTPVYYLAGLSVVAGYQDGTFRPYNQTTRAQLVKIVVLAFAKPIQTPAGGYTFADVPPDHPFFSFVETAYADGISTGYGCGGPGEPCDAQQHRYFRPTSNVTRGQLSKLVVTTAGWPQQTPTLATFADIPLDSPFAPFVETAACRAVLTGYNCGGDGEPCDPYRRAYFRPGNNATRGQIAKIVYSAVTNPGACVFPTPNPTSTATATPVAGPCTIFPADSIWHRDISSAPVHPQSAGYIASINANAYLHPGFASQVWQGVTLGNPITVVGLGQALVPIHFTLYPTQSDPGPYPVPTAARIEGGPNATGDRHVIIWDQGNCREYDLYRAFPNGDGSWNAGSGATWALTSNALRPDGWTSADAAGLPILPGLIRYDEVAAGYIDHAIRAVAYTGGISASHIWPARHSDGQGTGSAAMPMGARLRLKASVDISGFDPQIQVILRALQSYGLILADGDPGNSQIGIDGDYDTRWNDNLLQTLDTLHASDFEVVDVSGLMIDPNSGESR